jgi:hypothetical protein
MDAPSLTAFSDAEKAAILAALKRCLEAECRDPAQRTSLRIFLIERLITRLEGHGPPLELSEMILMFEATLAASRNMLRAPLH